MFDANNLGERMVFDFESVGLTHNKKEPVYKNQIAAPIFNKPDLFITRELKAKKIETLLETVGSDVRRTFPQVNFDLIPSIDCEGSQKAETVFNGILLTKNNPPTKWDDYDIYTSKASHSETARVAAHSNQTIRVGDPNYPPFDVQYVSDSFTKNRLFIADFQRLDGGYDQRMEAVLRVLKPSYFLYRENKNSNKLYFKANKFI